MKKYILYFIPLWGLYWMYKHDDIFNNKSLLLVYILFHVSINSYFLLLIGHLFNLL